jgi:hypothetical protein
MKGEPYLTFTGSQYFDTNLTFDSTKSYRIVVKFSTTTLANYQTVYSNGASAAVGIPKWKLREAGTQGFGSDYGKSALAVNTVYTSDATFTGAADGSQLNYTATINGVAVSGQAGIITGSVWNTLRICADNAGTTGYYEPLNGNLYYLKVYDSAGNLIADFEPQAGTLSDVTGNYTATLVGTTPTLGYEQTKGEPYVDIAAGDNTYWQTNLDLSTLANLRIIVKMSVDANPAAIQRLFMNQTYHAPYCSVGISNTGMAEVIANKASDGSLTTPTLSGTTTVTTDGKPHVYEFDYQEGRGFVDGVARNPQYGAGYFQTPLVSQYGLLCIADHASGNTGETKYYEVRVQDGDTVVADWVPDLSIPGNFYDLVAKATLAPTYHTATLGYDPLLTTHTWVECKARVFDDSLWSQTNKYKWLWGAGVYTTSWSDLLNVATSAGGKNAIRFGQATEVSSLPTSVEDWHTYLENEDGTKTNFYIDGQSIAPTQPDTKDPSTFTNFYLFAAPRLGSPVYTGCWEFATMRIWTDDPIAHPDIAEVVWKITVKDANTIQAQYYPGRMPQIDDPTTWGYGYTHEIVAQGGAESDYTLTTAKLLQELELYAEKEG